MEDKVLKCEGCKKEFMWSKEEQDLYKKRNLSEPSHCPICRGMMEAERKFKERK